jgi:hypothetical protein
MLLFNTHALNNGYVIEKDKHHSHYAKRWPSWSNNSFQNPIISLKCQDLKERIHSKYKHGLDPLDHIVRRLGLRAANPMIKKWPSNEMWDLSRRNDRHQFNSWTDIFENSRNLRSETESGRGNPSAFLRSLSILGGDEHFTEWELNDHDIHWNFTDSFILSTRTSIQRASESHSLWTLPETFFAETFSARFWNMDRQHWVPTWE